jgi:hypothetical protein
LSGGSAAGVPQFSHLVRVDYQLSANNPMKFRKLTNKIIEIAEQLSANELTLLLDHLRSPRPVHNVH